MSTCHKGAADSDAEADLDTLLVVRTVTVFIPASHCTPPPVFTATLARAVKQAHALRDALNSRGIFVQTTRVSTPGPAAFVPRGEEANAANLALAAARELDAAPVDYASLGTVHTTDPNPLFDPDFLVSVAAQTESVALSVQLCHRQQPPAPATSSAPLSRTHTISLKSLRAAAVAVPRIAALTSDGFSNLRFAAAAHIPPGGPFFPTSYAPCGLDGPSTASGDQSGGKGREEIAPLQAALGVQGATLLHGVVAQHTSSPSSASSKASKAMKHLTNDVTRGMRRLVALCAPVCPVRVDFSTAPLPEPGHGAAAPMMALAMSKKFPGPGGLSIAARVAAAIDAADFPRAGFCGIMLPVSEDSELAAAPPALHELLACSAVCGTGLDTVPVPGDASPRAIAGVLSDVAALSCRLGGKPLTARLMPVPGVKAGETTRFDSPYFSNGPVIALPEPDGTEDDDGATDGATDGAQGGDDADGGEVVIGAFRARDLVP